MKRVLRNGLIGLLFCAALTPVVSMAMDKKEESSWLTKTGKFAAISTVAYAISENLSKESVKAGFGWIGWALKGLTWDWSVVAIVNNPEKTMGGASLLAGPAMTWNNWGVNNGMTTLGIATTLFGLIHLGAYNDVLNKIQKRSSPNV